jgi:heme-degrading monooxygenase HmoA
VFIHLVLFKIRKQNVPTYIADCKLWEKEARRSPGFLGYHTLFRTNRKDHYASFYLWRSEKGHTDFMKKNHARLVSLSKCPVTVLGYYNFKT